MFKKLSKFGLALLLSMPLASQAETIDIGIMYSDAAAAKTSNINTKINQLISFSNQVYSQNGINITLRLVGTLSLGGNNVTPSSGWLNAVTDTGWIQDYRNQWGADMVAVLGTGQSAGSGLISCGIAWVGQGSNGSL